MLVFPRETTECFLYSSISPRRNKNVILPPKQNILWNPRAGTDVSGAQLDISGISCDEAVSVPPIPPAVAKQTNLSFTPFWCFPFNVLNLIWCIQTTSAFYFPFRLVDLVFYFVPGCWLIHQNNGRLLFGGGLDMRANIYQKLIKHLSKELVSCFGSFVPRNCDSRGDSRLAQFWELDTQLYTLERNVIIKLNDWARFPRFSSLVSNYLFPPPRLIVAFIQSIPTLNSVQE